MKYQYEADEQIVLRELAALGPDSAHIITTLELSREVVRAAMPILRNRRDAKVTLERNPGRIRFKHAFYCSSNYKIYMIDKMLFNVSFTSPIGHNTLSLSASGISQGRIATAQK